LSKPGTDRRGSGSGCSPRESPLPMDFDVFSKKKWMRIHRGLHLLPVSTVSITRCRLGSSRRRHRGGDWAGGRSKPKGRQPRIVADGRCCFCRRTVSGAGGPTVLWHGCACDTSLPLQALGGGLPYVSLEARGAKPRAPAAEPTAEPGATPSGVSAH
jgi:hypothetical protein